MALDDKLPEIETHKPADGALLTKSITTDGHGNTTITAEDGDVFVISDRAERALLWKFDTRILPLLAVMYLFNALDKS